MQVTWDVSSSKSPREQLRPYLESLRANVPSKGSNISVIIVGTKIDLLPLVERTVEARAAVDEDIRELASNEIGLPHNLHLLEVSNVGSFDGYERLEFIVSTMSAVQLDVKAVHRALDVYPDYVVVIDSALQQLKEMKSDKGGTLE
jgi:hypothetical protein